MTSETDEQFVERMTFPGMKTKEEMDRLFAIARRGAAVQMADDDQADRIAQLEAALRPFACTCKAKHQAECSRSEVDCPFWTARAALEERT
jgi:hypothetical protein